MYLSQVLLLNFLSWIFLVNLCQLWILNFFRPPFINGRPQKNDFIFGKGISPIFWVISPCFFHFCAFSPGLFLHFIPLSDPLMLAEYSSSIKSKHKRSEPSMCMDFKTRAPSKTLSTNTKRACARTHPYQKLRVNIWLEVSLGSNAIINNLEMLQTWQVELQIHLNKGLFVKTNFNPIWTPPSSPNFLTSLARNGSNLDSNLENRMMNEEFFKIRVRSSSNEKTYFSLISQILRLSMKSRVWY